MAEPDNERLAARLLTIGAALRDGGSNSRAPTVFTDEVLRALAKPIVQFVRAHVEAALAPLEARNAVTEQRLAEAEAALAECLKAGNIWNASTHYPANAVVTDHGKLWQAQYANLNERPPGNAWRLMHHKGL